MSLCTTYVDKGCRDDDTGTKLLDHHQDVAEHGVAHWEFGKDQWSKDTDATGHENHEDHANPHAFVVVAFRHTTVNLFFGGSANTVSER